MESLGGFVVLLFFFLPLFVILPYYLIYWLIKKGVATGNKELIESNTRNADRIVAELRKQNHNYVAVNAPEGANVDRTLRL